MTSRMNSSLLLLIGWLWFYLLCCAGRDGMNPSASHVRAGRLGHGTCSQFGCLPWQIGVPKECRSQASCCRHCMHLAMGTHILFSDLCCQVHKSALSWWCALCYDAVCVPMELHHILEWQCPTLLRKALEESSCISASCAKRFPGMQTASSIASFSASHPVLHPFTSRS